MCMTQILIAARAALILWVNLAVMPAEFVFDSIEAELKRRGIEPRKSVQTMISPYKHVSRLQIS